MGKPTIRFEGYTDDWEQRKFSDCYKMSSGYAFKMSDYCDEGVGLINGESIQHGIINDDNLNHLPESFVQHYPEFLLKENDIVVGLNRPITNGNLKIARIPSKYNDSLLYQRAGKIVYKTDCDKDFTYVLLSQEILKHTLVEAVGSDQPFISTSKLDGWKMMMPSDMEEQVKIGEYFQNLDHLITLHHRKCEETKKLKKFMLQKMFPKKGEKVPDIRFDGFTDDWEQRKLGEVCEIKDSARIPNSEWSETGVPYIRASDVTNENTDGVLFISQERYEFYKNRTGVPTKDDVLFNGGGEIGKSLLITDKKPIYVQGGAVLYARTSKSRELVGQYLKTYFETTNAKSYVDTASAGGTMRHFTLKPSQMMRILMPSVEEQEKIGEYFANLDHLITLHQRKYINGK